DVFQDDRSDSPRAEVSDGLRPVEGEPPGAEDLARGLSAEVGGRRRVGEQLTRHQAGGLARGHQAAVVGGKAAQDRQGEAGHARAKYPRNDAPRQAVDAARLPRELAEATSMIPRWTEWEANPNRSCSTTTRQSEGISNAGRSTAAARPCRRKSHVTTRTRPRH